MVHTVMVVDDAILMRNLVKGIINKWEGFEVVTTAANGIIALEELGKHPNLSRSIASRIPVVNAISACSGLRPVAKAFGAGSTTIATLGIGNPLAITTS